MKDNTKRKAPKVPNPNVKGNFMRESDKVKKKGDINSFSRRRDLAK